MPRSWLIPLLVSISLGGVVARPSRAQDAELPEGGPTIVWGTFVGGPGRTPRRTDVGAEPGEIALGETPWRCGYARARNAVVSDQDWSVMRVLACRRGEATASSTASCRVRNGEVVEHAATLSLGSVGEHNHVTVTLTCRGR